MVEKVSAPPQKKPRTKWCELFLLQEKKRRLTEEDWLPVTRPVPRSLIALACQRQVGDFATPRWADRGHGQSVQTSGGQRDSCTS